MNISIKDLLSDDSLSKKLESLTRLTVALAAISYAVGVLVINIYYGKYGYYSFSLFRVNYAIAGLWCLFVLGMSYFLAILLFESIAFIFKKGHTWKIRIMATLAVLISLCMIWYYVPQINKFLGIRGAWWLWLLTCTGGVVGVHSFRDDILRIGKPRGDYPRFHSMGVALLSISCLTGFLYTFSGTLYPMIPSQIGGGMHQNAQLILHRSVQPVLHQIGIPFVRNKSLDSDTTYCLTDTIHILLSTEQSVVVLPTDTSKQCIVINNQSVFGVSNISHHD